MVGVLNLKKNDVLDLTKTEPGLKNVMLAAGWDVAKKGFFKLGDDYDLDLIAILLNENDKLINRGVMVKVYIYMVTIEQAQVMEMMKRYQLI